MSTNRTPQLGAAMALVELLKENPELAAGSWSIDSMTGTLHGHLHGAGFEELAAYAEVLGGSIRPNRDYEYAGRMMRPHYLTATWRDVTVEVVVVLPAPVVEAVAA